MIRQFRARARAFRLVSYLLSLGASFAQPGPAGPAVNKGTLTVITGFGGQGYGQPQQLVEVSPGTFAGLALAPTQPGPHAFLLTSQGTLTSIYTFPFNTFLGPTLIQAVNGRLYGTGGVSIVGNFSLGLGGGIRTYTPVTAVGPLLSIQTLDGSLYGTEATYDGNNAFVRMALDGSATVLHNFSAAEGIPSGLPILGSDGNFYGISGLGTGPPTQNSTSAMVYRMTPSGDLTILATYPDGRRNYAPGSFQETLVQASNGSLYGTAALGGQNRAGAIFELSPGGTYKTLYEFTGFATGSPTFLIEGTDGNLYGVVQGQVGLGGPSSLFRITLAGQFERLQWLNGSQIGTCPCWLTLGSDGKFYGTTTSGGPGQGAAWTWDLGMPPPQPKVKGMQPASGASGTVVTIWGKFLLGATSVSFNGTPAMVFSNISADYVSATVPPGAASGPITVTTANGASASPGSFTVE